MLPSILRGVKGGEAMLPRAGCWGRGRGRAVFGVWATHSGRTGILGAGEGRAGRGEKRTERVVWGLAGEGGVWAGGCVKDGEGGTFSEADGRLSLEAGRVCMSTGVSPFRLHRNVF